MVSVLVAGLPGCGNRLVREVIRRHRGQAVINHAQKEDHWLSVRDRVFEQLTHLVVPYRKDEAARQESARRSGHLWSLDRQRRQFSRDRVDALRSLPRVDVALEDIVATRGLALVGVCWTIGLPEIEKPFPDEPNFDNPQFGRILTAAELKSRFP